MLLKFGIDGWVVILMASLFSFAHAVYERDLALTALALHHVDNPGTEYLKQYAPHLLAQLEDYTMNWLLVPKAIVYNEEALNHLIAVYQENLETGECPYVSKKMTAEQISIAYDRLFKFLKTEVAPILAKMPKQERSEKEDVAEEFIEEDFNDDAEGVEGEESTETSDNKESAQN